MTYWKGYSIIVLFICISEGESLKCPPGWVREGLDCFSVLHSPGLSGFRSVYEARATCNVNGGEIASLTSRESYHSVFEMLRSLPRDILPTRVYIGLNDIQNEGSYRWMDGSGLKYNMWGKNEPDNRYNNNEDCVLLESMMARWYDDGETIWKDYPCCQGEKTFAVICQRDINATGEVIQIDDKVNVFARACFSEVNECASNPCHNLGKCYDEFLDYRCVCSPGYTGKNCEEDLHCLPIQSWKDYNVSTRSTSYRTVLNVTCSSEHFTFPDGSPYFTSVCNSSGEWEPALEDCILPEKEHKAIRKRFTKPKEAEGAKAVGFIAILFVAFEVGLIVVLDLDYFIRHLMPLFAAIRKKLNKKNDPEPLMSTVEQKDSFEVTAGTSDGIDLNEDIGNGMIDSRC